MERTSFKGEKMKTEIAGGKSFSHLVVDLEPQEGLRSEPGAMASMDTGIDMMASFNGGFFSAILVKFLGKESLFISTYKNLSDKTQRLVLTKDTPGEIVEEKLDNEILYIQPGAYVAGSAGIKYRLSWAGFSSMLAGEGLFRIRVQGPGTVWYGAYGAVVEKEVRGEYIVDSGHLLSYPPNMKLKIKLSGGVFSSVFSGEGLVLKLVGSGKIKLQTRSLKGLAGWLNPRFWS